MPHAGYRVTVFTDLDHTMLGPGLDPGRNNELVRGLRLLDIPVVPVTAKTIDEVVALLPLVGLDNGEFYAVAENGATVYATPGKLQDPDGTERILGMDLEYKSLAKPLASSGLDEFFNDLKEPGCPIHRIEEIDDETLARLTKLPPHHVPLAKKRRYVLVLWSPQRICLEKAKEKAEERGYNAALGATFLHVYTHSGKQEGAGYLIENPLFRDSIKIGLGDSPIDEGLLSIVDYAIVLPRPSSRARLRLTRDFTFSPYPAPAGWEHMIKVTLLNIF